MASLLSTVLGTPVPKPWNNSKSSSSTTTTLITRRSFIQIPKSSSSSSSSSNNNDHQDENAMKIKYEGTWKREKKLTELIQKKIKEAEQVCTEDKSSDGCKVAWDEVEEISAAKANLKLQLLTSGDPLESFCQQNPDTEECRVDYDRD